MMAGSSRRHLLASTVLGGFALLAGIGASPARAQDAQDATEAQASATEVGEIVVTGSRIRRTATDTAAPVVMVAKQELEDRGYTQLGQALNAVTSVSPSVPLASGSGAAAGGGQQFPNLFGLGAGRTLTLVDGRRFVASASGVGDQVVDTNLIPIGLLDRVDVVQAGGAAVYGSDAIAGVVNFVLKRDFEGVELDAQTGISSRGDYAQNSLRATVGRNFADGRGNIAIDLEWSKTDPLLWKDRPATNPPFIVGGNNPANTGNTDGIPALIGVKDTRFWQWNDNGVIFAIPAPVTQFILGQFTPDGGGVGSFDPGQTFGIPFASGGDGFSYGELAALYSGVERKVANVVGHYDITDHLRLSGSLLAARTEGTDPYGSQGPQHIVLESEESGKGAIAFFADNPYLTPQQVADLTALSPSFAFGAPLFLSKQFADLLPTREFVTTTDSVRALLALDGDFDLGSRNFYYSASYSHGRVEGDTHGWDVNTARFNKAVQTLRNGSGDIVCAINAVSVVDPGCVPLNPFGARSVSPEARAYLAVPVGSSYTNTQDDFLATLGGTLFSLPGGEVKFSVGYEHRREEAEFTPSLAERTGLVGSGSIVEATGGRYNTNEFSAEVLVPVLGPEFNLPLVKALELSGQYRMVDNSIAGRENVWGLGLRWEVVDGLTLRASRSRNFRAPTLNQLVAPTSTTLTYAGQDPCDQRYIDTGPNPAVRRANCVAVFGSNPTYNGGTGSVAGYQDQNSNFFGSNVTTGGNPDLKNEVSDTTTFGVVVQPTFAPGLTIAIDRIEIDLTDGLSFFSPTEFMAACYDSVGMPDQVCSTFTRDANGDVVTGRATTFNAGSVQYRGETYNINYRFSLESLFHRDLGDLELALEATHNAKLETSVTGFDRTEAAGTTSMPDWVTRFDVRWKRGPLRLSYQAFYLPEAKVRLTDTIENTPYPVVDSNLRQSVSATYDFGKFQVRAGVVNFTDEAPSFPTINYGDILGRQYFVGLKARF
jgi:iron complex outermembrane receptor protein